MGKSSTELEREIVDLRSRLSDKTGHVKGRVQDDVEGVRDSFTQQVDNVKENANYHALEERVRQNPLTYTAGAQGVGVALGMLSDNISLGGGSSRIGSSAPQERHPTDGGILGGMLGSFTADLGGTIREEAQSLIRQAFEGFKAGPQGRQGDAERTAVGASHGQMVNATKP
jgi:ElaB/YqjD/DUF883 family membrane-anchored ribosome-binding protein